MKIVQINAVCGVGSTGGITMGISKMLTEHQIENYILYTDKHYEYALGIRYSNFFFVKVSALASRVFGNYGFNSHISTLKLIGILKEIKPDVVHIHNIHGHNVHLKMLFKYLKKANITVVWTLHDCWNFTGYCMHFDAQKCDKWKTQCENCPQAKQFSWFFDRCKWLYDTKKRLFNDIDDMRIVSPSQWLADLAEKSFIGKFPITVINNGINLELFKPTNSEFRQKYALENKKIVLGIPKGKLEYFIELSELLEEPYKLVLVGVADKDMTLLPENILAFPRQPLSEMPKFFTAADVYVNTTLEDTFPTVNLEAQACGTPVVTFNTGGSPEAIDEKTGISVPQKDINAIYEAIKDICNGEDRSSYCVERVNKLYDGKKCFEKYLEVYKGK